MGLKTTENKLFAKTQWLPAGCSDWIKTEILQGLSCYTLISFYKRIMGHNSIKNDIFAKTLNDRKVWLGQSILCNTQFESKLYNDCTALHTRNSVQGNSCLWHLHRQDPHLMSSPQADEASSCSLNRGINPSSVSFQPPL